MSTETACTNKTAFKHLPTNVKPVHYTITLKPDLVNFSFTGKETVKVNVNQSTNTILLNVLDMKVNSASFKGGDNQDVNATGIDINESANILTLTFPNELSLGNGELSIDFVGNLNNLMKGFYRSKSVNANKEEIYSASTQFEPTDARRAFPCWDEPAIKATFDMNLIVPKEKTALSNMDVVKEEEFDSTHKLVKFNTTPVMSTYLVAAAVGDYEYIEGKTTDGILMRFYAQKSQAELGRFSLEVGLKSLPFYKDYFGIAYPMSKMDFLSVSDFDAGAMENWGLVTYRESCVLFDPSHTSLKRKQMIAIFVAHELAHQWFGNLVTMEWWTDLWLNEGFATFMEFLCVDAIHPEYNIWNQFVIDILNSALKLDALDNSHPIEVKVNDPCEIEEIFDDISYSKGASVIRMMYDYIGDKSFKEGTHNYLVKYSYKNAITKDLWKSYEDSSGKPIDKLMSCWTSQKGYPVITVKSKQVGNERILSLTQEKFSFKEELNEQDKQSLWMIPISFCRESGKSCEQFLLQEKSGEVVLPNVKPDEWIKLNANRTGVYRINYSQEILDHFYYPIENKLLTPIDRLNILDDLFAIVHSGRQSTDKVLKLMLAFINEDDYTVWISLINCFQEINRIVRFTDYHEQYKAFGRKLFQNIYQKLGFTPKENEDHLTQLLRPIILGCMAGLDHPEVIAEAKKLFDDHYSGKKLILADLRGSIYNAVTVTSDESYFDKFIELYRKADLHDEKNKLIESLGYVRDTSLIEKYLSFISTDEIRSQDLVFTLRGLSSTRKGMDILWQFFQNNFDMIKNKNLSGYLNNIVVKISCSGFASEEKAKEVENFFNTHKMENAERAVQQSIELIRLNARWLNRDSDKIRDFLNKL